MPAGFAGSGAHGKNGGRARHVQGELDQLRAHHPQLRSQVPHIRAAQQVPPATLPDAAANLYVQTLCTALSRAGACVAAWLRTGATRLFAAPAVSPSVPPSSSHLARRRHHAPTAMRSAHWTHMHMYIYGRICICMHTHAQCSLDAYAGWSVRAARREMSDHFRATRGSGELTPSLRLLAGACAGIIAMSATYPLDMVGRAASRRVDVGSGGPGGASCALGARAAAEHAG
jgi:hypothetical protein